MRRIAVSAWFRLLTSYGNIGRLDLILEAENDTTNRYKLAKQADVLMLIYLLGPTGVINQLGRLGYSFSETDLKRTVEYYVSRSSEGSTLSRVVHSSVLSRFNEDRAWALFREAVVADLDDTQEGTTRAGIHLGAMAGTVDILTRSFAGLQAEANALTFDPRLRTHLEKVEFQIQYRGHLIDVALSIDSLLIRLHPSTAPPIYVGSAGAYVELAGGESTDLFEARRGLQNKPTPDLTRRENP